MLNKDEVARVEACIAILNLETENGCRYPSIETATVTWLATRLKEINNDLKESIDNFNELKKEVMKQLVPTEVHSDTVSLDTPNGTKLIATWDKGTSCYRCLFCDVPTFTATDASEHAAKEHIKKL
jgi:hypothetical protein